MINPDIHLCIVNDHSDIVPFLHQCWKRKLMPFYDNKIVHFDSHPDLSLPRGYTIANLEDPKLLLNILETEDGISEFLLPLVSNKNIDQICWVRPRWCRQEFQTGKQSFHIGDICVPNCEEWRDCSDSGTLGVSCQDSYYFEDGSVFETHELSSTSLGKFKVV